MTIRDAVSAQFEQVAGEQGRKLATLSENLLLAESGLDSLCFAIIVVRLEDALGIDPFLSSPAGAARFPVTFGDFVARYERAAK